MWTIPINLKTEYNNKNPQDIYRDFKIQISKFKIQNLYTVTGGQREATWEEFMLN